MPIIYGCGIGGDYLFNENLGNVTSSGIKIQFMRFRAATSSALNSVTQYYQATGGSGYSGGTGGTWSAAIYADDGTANHFPTGAALATQSIAAQGTSTIEDFKVTWTTPATLVAGQLYHYVMTNTDAANNTNYWSPNYYYYDATPASTGSFNGSYSPRATETDWGHGYYNDPSGPWSNRTGFQPILSLTYANGVSQGQCYGEASLSSGQEGKVNGTANLVREQFTVPSTGPWVVYGAGIRLIKIAGGTDVLTVTLQDASRTLIDSFTIPAANVPNGVAPTTGTGLEARWVNGLFSTGRQLASSTQYYLQLSTAAGTTYWAWTNRQLCISHTNYPAITGFPNACAQFSSNTGSTWTNLGDAPGPPGENDLQMYLLGDDLMAQALL